MIKLLLAILFLSPFNAFSAELTRGVRNNNPGNLRPDDWKVWPKAIGQDKEGYVIFRNQTDGIRAIVINLKQYKKKYNTQTIDAIFERWVDDLPRVKRDEYKYFISTQLNIPIRARLNLNDPYTLKSLTRAIVRYENGYDPYTDKVYKRIFPYT